MTPDIVLSVGGAASDDRCSGEIAAILSAPGAVELAVAGGAGAAAGAGASVAFCWLSGLPFGLISMPRESLVGLGGALAARAMIVAGGLPADAATTAGDGFVSAAMRATAGSVTSTGAAATFVGESGVAATCCWDISRFKRSISNRASDEKLPLGYCSR